MKKLSILCLLAIIPFLLIAQEKGIQFVEGTFAEALDKAAKENKNVFVDCYASWCGPCRYMANRVFNTDTVGNYMNSRYVSFKVDMEKGEGPKLQKQFKIKAYPTFIIFNPAGKELGRFAGTTSVSQFIEYIGIVTEGKDIANLQEKEKNADLQRKDTIYDEGKGVKFLDISYEQAIEIAKMENKRIFIDCYASWCAPCRKMLNTTFKDTRIGNLLNFQFIVIKVNMEKEKDGKMLKINLV